MTITNKLDVVRKLLYMRFAQILVNERYKNKEFEIPIHLALGHEAIAIAVSEAMGGEDRLILSHRNIHYNLARGATLRALLDEYFLKPEGLAHGTQGSMNLSNQAAGILYTSSILGNNLGFGAGVALSMKAQKKNGVTFTVTGDGAMEEGSFYETLLLFSAQSLPGIIIVENNEWSLGSMIDERRAPIDVKSLAEGSGAGYEKFLGNDVYAYIDKMAALRSRAESEKKAIVVEVELKTLGDWRLKTDDFPDGKFINYHAGPAPTIELTDWPLIQDNDGDPLSVLASHFNEAELRGIALDIKEGLVKVAQ